MQNDQVINKVKKGRLVSDLSGKWQYKGYSRLVFLRNSGKQFQSNCPSIIRAIETLSNV